MSNRELTASKKKLHVTNNWSRKSMPRVLDVDDQDKPNLPRCVRRKAALVNLRYRADICAVIV